MSQVEKLLRKETEWLPDWLFAHFLEGTHYDEIMHLLREMSRDQLRQVYFDNPEDEEMTERFEGKDNEPLINEMAQSVYDSAQAKFIEACEKFNFNPSE